MMDVVIPTWPLPCSHEGLRCGSELVCEELCGQVVNAGSPDTQPACPELCCNVCQPGASPEARGSLKWGGSSSPSSSL